MRSLFNLIVIGIFGHVGCGATPVTEVEVSIPERDGFGRDFLCATSVGGVMRRGEPPTSKAEVLMTLRYDEPRADSVTCRRLGASGCEAEVSWVEVIACSDPITGQSSILYAETSEVRRAGSAPVVVTQPYFGHFMAELGAETTAADLRRAGKLDMVMSLEGRRYPATLSLAVSGDASERCGVDRFTMTPQGRFAGAPVRGGRVVSCK